jgi:hypothetical protein
VLSNTFSIAVARSGAVLLGVRSPGANQSCAGVNHALTQFPVPAVGTPNARLVASRRAPAMARPAALMAAALPTNVRKQYVHKTRVNAGGDGASGPHPEREPA